MYPLELTPLHPKTDKPVQWMRQQHDHLTQLLRSNGAVLLRGLHFSDWQEVEDFGRLIVGQPMPYRDRATPRSEVHGYLVTSTDASPRYTINLHCESMFAERFPQRLFFYCKQPAAEGGETSLANVSNVYHRIKPSIRERFESQGVKYVRFYGLGPGMDYREALQVEGVEGAEKFAVENNSQLEWVDNNVLKVSQTRPAVLRHPEVGNPAWINHINVLHRSATPEPLRILIRQQYGDDVFLQDTFYGDGGEIDDSVVNAVRSSYLEEKTMHRWQKGDCLILDNLQVAHGREAFRGKREVVCLMGSESSWRKVQPCTEVM